MSRCPRTGPLLDAVFGDAGPTGPQAEHAASCAECAGALAFARRFDGDLHRVCGDIAAQPATDGGVMRQVRGSGSKGGREMWRTPVLLAAAVAVAAVAVLGVAVVANAPLGQLQAGRIGVEELALWLDRARAATHDDLDRGGQTAIDEWEPAHVEVCGATVVAFFGRTEEHGIGYRWAVGRPGDWLDRSIETGSSRTLAAPDVAERRAALPVCTVAVGGDGLPAFDRDLQIAPQEVVRVPGLFWMGDPDDAPFEVEVIGPQQDVVVDVGIASEGYLAGRLDDPSVRAIDLVTEAGRYRYTVAAPGFVLQADPSEGQIAYELLDASGSVVVSGWVLDLDPGDDRRAEHEEEARRAQAEASARAEAARRAAEQERAGATCAEWARMTADEQLQLTELLVVPFMEAVRTRQQLPADATWAEITTAARASLDKSCQGSPADRHVGAIADELYGGG